MPLVQKSLFPFLSSKYLLIFLCSGLRFITELTKTQAVVLLSIKHPPLVYVCKCSVCKSHTKQRYIVAHLSLCCTFSPSLMAIFSHLHVSHVLDEGSLRGLNTSEGAVVLVRAPCRVSCRIESLQCQTLRKTAPVGLWDRQGAAKTLKTIRRTNGNLSVWQDWQVCTIERNFGKFIGEDKKTTIGLFPSKRKCVTKSYHMQQSEIWCNCNSSIFLPCSVLQAVWKKFYWTLVLLFQHRMLQKRNPQNIILPYKPCLKFQILKIKLKAIVQILLLKKCMIYNEVLQF